MNVEVAVLADAANQTADGKLNVTGVFNLLRARSFPTLHPMMVLVLRLRIDYADAGRQHSLDVLLRDEDHDVLMAVNAVGEAPAIQPGHSPSVNQILPMAGTVFPKAGTYVFEVLWDGQRVAAIPFLVQQVTPAGDGPEASG